MSDYRCTWCERYRDKSEFHRLATELNNDELVCEDCSDAVIDEFGQFGVGA